MALTLPMSNSGTDHYQQLIANVAIILRAIEVDSKELFLQSSPVYL